MQSEDLILVNSFYFDQPLMFYKFLISKLIDCFCILIKCGFDIGQLPRVSTEDRVVSVFETLDSWLSANFLIFPSFILLFLYSTVQKSAVQYRMDSGVWAGTV